MSVYETIKSIEKLKAEGYDGWGLGEYTADDVLEAYHSGCSCESEITKLTAERDALKAENEQHVNKVRVEIVRRTNAETERDRYRGALKDIASHCCHPDCNHQEVARDALGETK